MNTTASTGLNLTGVADSYLHVLARPSETSFRIARASSNTSSTLIALLIVGAMVGLFSRLASGGWETVVVTAVLGAVLGVIGYYILQAILFVFAKVFGGRGGLAMQANTLVTFYAPLTLINALFGLFPDFGFFVSLVIAIYELVLLTLGLKVVHEYSTGRAVLTWLMPAVALFVVVGILVVLSGAFILGTLQ